MDSETFFERYSAGYDVARRFLAERGISEPKPIAAGPPTDFQTIEARILAWREKALATG
jgi:hypothetical protein